MPLAAHPRRILALCVAICALVLAPACSRTPQDDGKLRVVVSIAPLHGLVKPLLPADAELTVLIAPGHSEHGYELSTADAATLDRADLIVLVGLGLETQIEDFLRKHPSDKRRILHFASAAGIAPATPAPDPHLWLDPVLCTQLIPALRQEIAAADRGRHNSLPGEDAERKLIQEILAVDDEYRRALAPLAGRAIVTHHAGFSRMVDRYGMRVAAVIRESESSEPDAAQSVAVIDAIKKEHVPAIFVEPQFDAKAAQRLADAAGVAVGHLDPLGDGDWFALMRSNLRSITTAFAAN